MRGVDIYVADNGSTDLSVSLVREFFPTVRMILLGANLGFATGYNRALQQIHSDYAVLLNSDVQVTEHWLEPLISYMDIHAEVAACQPKILSWQQKDYFEYAGAAGGFIDRYGYPFCRGRLLGTVEKDTGQYDTVIPVFWATGAALCIRLKDYREAGGLDKRFFAHMEEIDLCWRLRSRNRKIVCIPQSKVYHIGAATLKKESSWKTYLNFRNNLLMLYKNLPEEELLSVMRVRRILDYAAALVFLLQGQKANALAVIRAWREYGRIRFSFLSARTENMEKRILRDIPEKKNGCVLVWYYIRGKRRFSQL
jgi:GT2 family glycosyltransferase